PRVGPCERCGPHVRQRLAQRGGHGVGAQDRRALDGGQRTGRTGRRDASGLSHLGARRGFLRLALFLLGADGGRQSPTRSCDGREGHHAGLRAGRTYRVTRPLLAAGRHGDRPARLLEPQQAEWIQADLHSVREWASIRAVARYPVRLPCARRTGILWTAGGSDDRPRRLRADGGRRGRRHLARDERSLRSRAYRATRAAWMASHTLSGVTGMSISCTPTTWSASSTAFITAGRLPAQPASPQPFAPR